MGGSAGAGRGHVDERSTRAHDIAMDNIDEKYRVRDLAESHATRTRDVYPMDKAATAAEQAAQKHLANVYESQAEDMAKRPDSFANGGQVGHTNSFPKKPNPPVIPFGSQPGAKPC